jgi:hypothetical protein
MGGRNTYAAGRNAKFTYKTVGRFRGIKVLEGMNGKHNLPEEAHTSKAYVKLFKDGNLQMLRRYDNDHFLVREIGYHPEPSLTGHHNPVYHIHEYSRDFKQRPPRLFSQEDVKKYGKYLTVEGHLK